MDFSGYDEKTTELIRECEHASAAVEPGARRSFDRLKKLAAETGDEGLLGYACYYAANWHYERAEYSRFQNELKQAIQCFLRTEGHEMLARAYNYFAIDAQANDAFDIAYSYYTNALHFVDEDVSPLVAGAIQGNLAYLHYMAGDHALARRFYRKSIRLTGRGGSDAFYRRNLIVVHTNDGLNSIAMGDLAAAETSFRKAESICSGLAKEEYPDVRLAFLFFKARLLLAKRDRGGFERQIREIIDDLSGDVLPSAFMDDIRDFCYSLLAKKKSKYVREILDVVRDRVRESGETQPIRLLAQIEVDVCDSIGDEERLTECLQEQHHLLLLQNKQKKRIYMFSMELVRLIGELQEEEMHVREENRDLQTEAVTDALTRIPNRGALDRELAEALQRARKTRGLLGVEIMDIDGFKSFNDSLGHQTGDLVLAEIGKILKRFAKEKGIFCARFGGDEFVVIYEGMSRERILAFSGKIGKAIASAGIAANGRSLRRHITVSQGICADVPRRDTRPWDYLSQADAALYSVKRKHVASDEARPAAVRKLAAQKRSAK